MDKDYSKDSNNMQIAVRCTRCMRIIAYKIAAGTGRIQMKCPKCGKEMIIDLSLRRTKRSLFYRMENRI